MREKASEGCSVVAVGRRGVLQKETKFCQEEGETRFTYAERPA